MNRTGALQRTFQTNPEYLSTSRLAERLTAAIEYAIANDRRKAAAFIMHLSSQLKRHAEFAVRQLQKGADENVYAVLFRDVEEVYRINSSHEDMIASLSTSLEEIPALDTLFAVNRRGQPEEQITGLDLLQKWSDSNDVDSGTKKLVDTYLLENFYHSALEELTVDDWVHMLRAYAFVKNVGDDAGNPSLQARLFLWMNEKVLPCFEETLDSAMKRVILGRFALKEGRAQLPEWIHPGDYTYTTTDGRLTVNVQTGMVQNANGNPCFETMLPEAVSSDKNYQLLFGQERPEVSVVPSTKGHGEIFIYAFDKNGHQFSIEHNTLTQEITIFQKMTLGTETALYCFKPVEGMKGNNAPMNETLLQRYGIWQQVDDPSRGCVILNVPHAWSLEDILQVQLREEGKSYAITSCQTLSGKEIYNDETRRYLNIFPFAAPADTLFLRESGSSCIDEVRFLSKGLTLKRLPDGRWKGTDQYSDFYLVQEPERLKQLTDLFGEDFHTFMLPLESLEEATGVRKSLFLTFPTRMIPGSRPGVFEVDTTLNAEAAFPPLRIHVESGKVDDSDGKLRSTTAGFMNLTYQYYVRGDYQRALRYLSLAQDSPFGAHDREIFEAIVKGLRDYPDESTRGAAFRLKAEAAIHRIERDQLGKRGFDPSNWKAYLDKVSKDARSYRHYQENLNDSSKGIQKQRLLSQELLLTREETAFFDKLINESMDFLVDQSLQQPNTPMVAPEPFKTIPLKTEQVLGLVHQLVQVMIAPEPSHRLEELSLYVNKEDFLSKFWGFAKQIHEESISTSDWRIQKLQNLILAHLPKEDLQPIRVARQLLIQIAKINDLTRTSNEFEARQNRFEQEISEDESGQDNYEAYQHAKEELNAFLAEGIHFMPDDDLFRQVDAVIKPFTSMEDLTMCSLIWLFIKMIISKILSWFCCIPELKMPDVIYEDLMTSFQWIQTLDAKIQAIEEIMAPTVAPQKQPQEDYDTTIQKIEDVLSDSDSPLTSQERAIWTGFIERLRDENPTQEKMSLMHTLLGLVEMKMHVPSMRYEVENIRIAHELEDRIAANQGPSSVFVQTQVLSADDEDFIQESKNFFAGIVSECFIAPTEQEKEEQLQRYEIIQENVLSYYPDDPSLSAMENKENERRRAGIEAAAQIKREEICENKGIIAESRLDNIKDQLDERLHTKKGQLTELKASILQTLRDNAKFIPSLKQLIQQEDIYGSAEIFERTLDLYQLGRLRPTHSASSQEVFDQLEGSIDRYLLEAIEQQQLLKARNKLAELYTLKTQKEEASRVSDATTRSQRLEELKAEWTDASAKMHLFLRDAARKDRYCESENDPSFTRKHLMAEYRSELVARPHQPSVMRKLVDEKNVLVLARPGDGKSKWYLPMIALMEAEKGKFPVILVTDDLIHINHQDLDQSTREISRLASHIFNYSRETSKEIGDLIAEYNRLQTAKLSQKGYVVTTISRLAALDDEISLISEEMGEKLDALQNYVQAQGLNATAEQLSKDLITLQKQKHWLTKIRSLFQQEETQYIADEVDDIFNINRDYNYALGKQRAINSTALEGAHYLMETLLSTQDEALCSLGQLIAHNEQVNLNPHQIKSYMEAAATAIYHDPNAFGLPKNVWEAIKGGLTEDEFVTFTTGSFEGVPEGVRREVIAGLVYDQPEAFKLEPARWAEIKSQVSKEEFVQFIIENREPPAAFSRDEALTIKNSDLVENCDLKYISVAKRLLSKTLPNAIKEKRADVDFGLTSDGYTVVPKTNGRESKGVRFADEYELIIYHYLYYASKHPSLDYFQQQWRTEQDRINAGIPSVWTNWYLEAGVDHLQPKDRLNAIFERFKDPELSWKQRFALLREDILKERVKLYSSQIKCNSQDPLGTANVAGVSGTVNEYALPESSTRDDSVHSREVMGDTLLLLSSMDLNLFDQEVVVYDDAQELLLQLARNNKCKSNIDQGASMESVDALEVVHFLRSQGINRQLLFVHPRYRKQWMWNPGEDAPKPYDNSPLASDCFVYYAPENSRGTDWRLPPGENALIIGPAAKDDEFVQSAWRLRLLGKGQTLKCYIHRSVQKAHHLASGNADLEAPVALGALLNDVKLRTLDQKAANNYKAALKNIQSIVPQAVKKSLFAPYVADEESYWDVTPDRPLKLQQIYSDIVADVEAYRATRELFVAKKEIRFDTDLMASTEVDTTDYLFQQFDQQELRAHRLKQSISEIPSAVEDRLLVLTQAMQILPAFANVASRPHTATLRRIQELEDCLDHLTDPRGPIDQRIASFTSPEQMQRHRENLKTKQIVAAGDETSDQQELVQEQQQQQQQQQQMTVHFAGNRAKTYTRTPYQWKNWPKEGQKYEYNNFFRSVINEILRGDQTHRELRNYETHFPHISSLDSQDCGFDPHLRCTENFKKLWQEASTKKGELMGRFAVIQDRDTHTKQVILLDQLDYERGFAEDLTSDNRYGFRQFGNRVGVYSLNSKSLNENIPSFLCINGLKQLPEEDDGFYEDLVQISLLSGKIFFTQPQEQAALTRWLERLTPTQKTNLKAFLAKIHKVSNVTQIPEWRAGYLAQVL